MGDIFKKAYLSIALLLFLEGHSSGKTVAPQVPQKTPGFSKLYFKNFKSLRSKVLNLIGSSRKRVILVSDFLTDGDISSALYIAKYRKVKVNVLLNKKKANKYLSRVRFLNQQGIPVSYRPRNISIKNPTLLLVDNRLYKISRDLDVLRPDISSTMVQASPKGLNIFLKSLIKIFKNHKGIRTTPLPKVGRPRRNQGYTTRTRKPYKGNRDGSYNYDRSRPSPRPNNVRATLPKSTVFQKKQRLKIIEQERAEEQRKKELAKKKELQDKLNTRQPDFSNRDNIITQPFSEETQ